MLGRLWCGGWECGLRTDLELWATERGWVFISACPGLRLHLPTSRPQVEGSRL